MDDNYINSEMAYLKGKNACYQKRSIEDYSGKHIEQFRAGFKEAEETLWEEEEDSRIYEAFCQGRKDYKSGKDINSYVGDYLDEYEAGYRKASIEESNE